MLDIISPKNEKIVLIDFNTGSRLENIIPKTKNNSCELFKICDSDISHYYIEKPDVSTKVSEVDQAENTESTGTVRQETNMDPKTINSAIEDAGMLIIVCPHSKALPDRLMSIIRSAKEQEILTIVLIADLGKNYDNTESGNHYLDSLAGQADLICEISAPEYGMGETTEDPIATAENTICTLVRSVSNLGTIRIDIDDIKNLADGAGSVCIGYGNGKGGYAAVEAVIAAMKMCTINSINDIIMYFEGDLSIVEISEATRYIQERVSRDARIVFGVGDDGIEEGASVLLIAANKDGYSFEPSES